MILTSASVISSIHDIVLYTIIYIYKLLSIENKSCKSFTSETSLLLQLALTFILSKISRSSLWKPVGAYKS